MLSRPFLFLCAACFSFGASPALGDDFWRGADLSALPIYEARGAHFTQQGKVHDALELLKAQGMNGVRLRLFVQPTPTGIVDNSLEYTVALARRVKAAGVGFMLDLHYSDTWADPRAQRKPAGWENLNFDELVARVGSYTREVLARFEREGLRPDFVQIGNEITYGMLWPEGRVKYGAPPEEVAAAWSKLGRLLRAGLEAVPRGVGQSRTILHIECGGQLAQTQDWLRHARAEGLVWDVIGFSYYPDWHGGLENFQRTLQTIAQELDQPIMVVEAGYPWQANEKWRSKSNMDWPLTPAGQAQFLRDVVQMVQALPHGLGRGVWYWHPESIQMPGHYAWEGGTCALFDPRGELLPGAAALFGAQDRR